MSQWVRSSRSVNGSACVEVAVSSGWVRDSKDPEGPWLPADVTALVRAIRAGRFDR